MPSAPAATGTERPPLLASAPVRLLVGRARPFGPNGEPSAIDKHAVDRPLKLGTEGFEGDEQGDRRHHGGPEKAVHHYPGEHYAAWRRDLPALPPDLFRIGAFGENLGTTGLTESNVCVGDVFRLGSALVQVSQARQPCWKLNLRFATPDMSRRVQDSARTGWYYRVLETGEVAPGAPLRLLERPHPAWPLARLLHHLYVDPLHAAALDAITALPALSASWRELARRRLETGRVEDWLRRLNTPATSPIRTRSSGEESPAGVDLSPAPDLSRHEPGGPASKTGRSNRRLG